MTRNITRALALFKLGLEKSLYIDNLIVKRNWSHARDFVEMQCLMLQQDESEYFVIATWVPFSVRDFVDAAANELNMRIRWEGDAKDEKGYADDVRSIVAVDECYIPSTEVETLLGYPSNTKQKLGWIRQISFKELVIEMVREDKNSAKRDKLINKSGFGTLGYHE